ncbi:hypothetical protein NL676_034974 [Syzygium grande]|nr:hypothetical protein NL676_034974 [Syzygium grande]
MPSSFLPSPSSPVQFIPARQCPSSPGPPPPPSSQQPRSTPLSPPHVPLTALRSALVLALALVVAARLLAAGFRTMPPREFRF